MWSPARAESSGASWETQDKAWQSGHHGNASRRCAHDSVAALERRCVWRPEGVCASEPGERERASISPESGGETKCKMVWKESVEEKVGEWAEEGWFWCEIEKEMEGVWFHVRIYKWKPAR